MELREIENVLEKYFEGETTLSEEKELKVYFTGEQVAPHLEKYKYLFQYYAKESQLTSTSTYRFEAKKSTSWYTWIGVAASIALVVGLFLTTSPKPPKEDGLGTYEDPEIALQKAKEALNLVAQYMNEGKQGLVYLKEFENTKSKLIK